MEGLLSRGPTPSSLHNVVIFLSLFTSSLTILPTPIALNVPQNMFAFSIAYVVTTNLPKKVKTYNTISFTVLRCKFSTPGAVYFTVHCTL